MAAASTLARSALAIAAPHSASSTFSRRRHLHSAHPLFGKHVYNASARTEHDLALTDIDHIECSDPSWPQTSGPSSRSSPRVMAAPTMSSISTRRRPTTRRLAPATSPTTCAASTGEITSQCSAVRPTLVTAAPSKARHRTTRDRLLESCCGLGQCLAHHLRLDAAPDELLRRHKAGPALYAPPRWMGAR